MSRAPSWLWFLVGVPFYCIYQLWCLVAYGTLDWGGGKSPGPRPWWLGGKDDR